MWHFITCKSKPRKTIFEITTTYVTDVYYRVFKPDFFCQIDPNICTKYFCTTVLDMLKMYYKSYKMGDVSESLLLLIPSLSNPKFCFRLFLV